MRLAAVLGAVATALLPASSALAGPVAGGEPSFRFEVSSSLGGPPIYAQAVLTPGPNGTFSAVGSETHTYFEFSYDLDLNADPSLSGSFTLLNLFSSQTQTFTVTATLSVPPVAGPTAIRGFYGEATFRDTNLDSGVTLGTGFASPFYEVRIDGTAVGRFGSYTLDALGAPGIYGETPKAVFGPEPGPAVASSIGIGFPGFTLTRGDTVEVPFAFSVVPEPGFASLFAAMAGTFLARAQETTRV